MKPSALGCVAAAGNNSSIFWLSGHYSTATYIGMFLGDCAQNYTTEEMSSLMGPRFDLKTLGLQKSGQNYLRLYSSGNQTGDRETDTDTTGDLYTQRAIDVDRFTTGRITVKNAGADAITLGILGTEQLPVAGPYARLTAHQIFNFVDNGTREHSVAAGAELTLDLIKNPSAAGAYYPMLYVGANHTKTTFDLRVLDWRFTR